MQILFFAEPVLLDQVQKMGWRSKIVLKDQKKDSLGNGVLPLSSNTTDLQAIPQATSQKKGRGLFGRQWMLHSTGLD